MHLKWLEEYPNTAASLSDTGNFTQADQNMRFLSGGGFSGKVTSLKRSCDVEPHHECVAYNSMADNRA